MGFRKELKKKMREIHFSQFWTKICAVKSDAQEDQNMTINQTKLRGYPIFSTVLEQVSNNSEKF